jgi:hypothetical protein
MSGVSIPLRHCGVRLPSGLAREPISPSRLSPLTGFVLAGNTLLRPLVNAINRRPIDEGTTEAIYEVRITTNADHLDDARELLREVLETANYPLQGMEVIEREQGGIELVATLAGDRR